MEEEAIISLGDMANSLYIIQEGEAVLKGGIGEVDKVLKVGDFFGEQALF